MKNTVRYISILLTAAILYSCSDGLSDFQKKSFIKFYGSYQNDIGRDIQVLPSGGYVLTGVLVPEDSIPKMFFMETDEFGNQVENSPILFGGDNATAGESLLVLDDGYLIAGQMTQPVSDGKEQTDIYIVRLDASGQDTLWTKTIGGDSNESVSHVVKRSAGGFVLAGKKAEGIQDDLWVLMIDENGKVISEFLGNNKISNDEAKSIHNTGSGYLVSCTYDDGAFAGLDLMVLYLDENCNLFDARSMGTNFDDDARNIIVYNGAYLLMGNTDNTALGNFQIGLYTFSLDGNLIKNQLQFATISETGADLTGECCTLSSNGDIAIAGSQVLNENRDMLLQFVKPDGTFKNPDGTLMKQLFGKIGSQVGYVIRPTLDGGLILTGSNNVDGNSVVSLVKTDSEGKF